MNPRFIQVRQPIVLNVSTVISSWDFPLYEIFTTYANKPSYNKTRDFILANPQTNGEILHQNNLTMEKILLTKMSLITK